MEDDRTMIAIMLPPNAALALLPWTKFRPAPIVVMLEGAEGGDGGRPEKMQEFLKRPKSKTYNKCKYQGTEDQQVYLDSEHIILHSHQRMKVLWKNVCSKTFQRCILIWSWNSSLDMRYIVGPVLFGTRDTLR